MKVTTEDSKLLENQGEEEKKSLWSYICGITTGVLNAVTQLGGVAFMQLMIQMPPNLELSAFCFGTGFLISATSLAIMRTSPKMQKESIKWMVCLELFAIIYNIAMYSHYLKKIPLVTLLCIHQSFKLIMSLFLSRIFLRKTIPVAKCVVCFITFAGAIFTVIPRVEVYLDMGNSHRDQILETFNGTNTSGITHSNNLTSHLNMTYEHNTTQSDDVIYRADITKEKDVIEFIITMAVISCASLGSVAQIIVIGGSSLKYESVNVLTFWNLLIGFTILLPTTFILEKPFIPDNIDDILFCIGHSLAAYLGTIFSFLGTQMLEVNTLTVVTTVRLPLGFLAEETFLKNVVPVKSVYLLVIGTIITSLTTVAMPVYEIWFSK